MRLVQSLSIVFGIALFAVGCTAAQAPAPTTIESSASSDVQIPSSLTTTDSARCDGVEVANAQPPSGCLVCNGNSDCNSCCGGPGTGICNTVFHGCNCR